MATRMEPPSVLAAVAMLETSPLAAGLNRTRKSQEAPPSSGVKAGWHSPSSRGAREKPSPESVREDRVPAENAPVLRSVKRRVPVAPTATLPKLVSVVTMNRFAETLPGLPVPLTGTSTEPAGGLVTRTEPEWKPLARGAKETERSQLSPLASAVLHVPRLMAKLGVGAVTLASTRSVEPLERLVT